MKSITSQYPAFWGRYKHKVVKQHQQHTKKIAEEKRAFLSTPTFYVLWTVSFRKRQYYYFAWSFRNQYGTQNRPVPPV